MQYGHAYHAIDPTKTVGSVHVEHVSDDRNVFTTKHILIKRSSQWVFGKSEKTDANIEHIQHNRIVFHGPNGRKSMIFADVNHLSYVLMFYISKQTNEMTITALICMKVTLVG